MRIIITSLYGNPLHSGHISYLEEARKLGDELWVIVNNDKQALLKKGFSFLPLSERMSIIESLRCVDLAFPSIDEDLSVSKTLDSILNNYKLEIFENMWYFSFANGGDVTSSRESEVCKKYGVNEIFGVGKDKVVSSTDFLEKHAIYVRKELVKTAGNLLQGLRQ